MMFAQSKENINCVHKPLTSPQSFPSNLKPKCKCTTIVVSFAMWVLCLLRDLLEPYISKRRKCRFLTRTVQRMQGRRFKKYPLKTMQTLCNSSYKETVWPKLQCRPAFRKYSIFPSLNTRLNTELVPQRSTFPGAAASTTKIQIWGLSMTALTSSLHGNNDLNQKEKSHGNTSMFW
jgi:hypothetical protein